MISALLSASSNFAIGWDTLKYYAPYAVPTIPATVGTAFASRFLTDPNVGRRGGFMGRGFDQLPGGIGLGASWLTALAQAYIMYNKRAELTPEERAASRWAYLGFPTSQAATAYAASPSRTIAPYIMAPSVISSLLALLAEYYYDRQAEQQPNTPLPSVNPAQ